ncbi:MAG: alpha/beta fold hydrolase [Pseudomonadota bacterium]|nr:alpha/beta fold hydrolase [Pseudomonadota bacterium]
MSDLWQQPLACERIEPESPADACVIWLHGLGASGHDFVPVVPHLQLPESLAVRFLFPHAPSLPVTCNGGLVMPAWYDILALTEIREVNLAHLARSRQAVGDLIQQQLDAGIDSRRIILIGFSQGGAVAYHCALQYPLPLGGLIALSTYLPGPETLDPVSRQPNQQLPIHIAQGEWDDMVTERAARAAYTWLQEQGYTVDWQLYPMGHEVCVAEIRQIGRWLRQWLL